jgi:AbrB family looped-hinge helix DNA binding protein
MRITSKGQVTIPVDVREKAGLLPNTEVEFVVRGNVVVLRKAGRPPRRGRRLVALMRGKGTKRMTTDEIMALTRG